MGRLMGKVDIREHGSGNVGATNIFRTLGPQVAIPAGLGDIFKGVLAAWAASYFGDGSLIFWCCMAVVVGHCYSMFLGFKGGKGVATSGGILLFLMPKVLLVLLVIFIAVVAVSKYVSLGSVTVAFIAPFATVFFYSYRPYFVLLAIFLAVFVIYRHHENIKRLADGTESRIAWKGK
jgi:glycerol-3-phosphate acyltransferase PlsY